jgi:hypothetical protein
VKTFVGNFAQVCGSHLPLNVMLIAHCIQAYTRIDALINNAGIMVSAAPRFRLLEAF